MGVMVELKPELVAGHSPASKRMWEVSFSVTRQWFESKKDDDPNIGFDEDLTENEKVVSRFYMMAVMRHINDVPLPDFFVALLPLAKELMEDRAEQWIRDLEQEVGKEVAGTG